MAITIGPQEIPAELSQLYLQTLRPMTPIGHVQKRYPWRVPTIRDRDGHPSIYQHVVRHTFRKCVRCFECQPWADPDPPPAEGPRGRQWWFSEAAASGMWYYNYFMMMSLNSYFNDLTPSYCRKRASEMMRVNSQEPDTNYQGHWTGPSLRVYKFGDVEWRSFIRNPTAFFGAVNLKKASWIFEETKHYNYIDFLIYEVTAAWSQSTITWNNQPALGAVLGVFRFYRANLWSYFLFHRPPSSICLVWAAGDAGMTISRTSGVPGDWPFFSA